MLEQVVICSLEFARSAKILRGKIEASDLQRMSDLLYDGEGRVEFGFQGALNPDGKPHISLSLDGGLNLVCQRCLERLPFVVHILKTFLLVPDERLLGDTSKEEENIETVVISQKMVVLELIEDEIILSIPISPTHTECSGVSLPPNRLSPTV